MISVFWSTLGRSQNSFLMSISEILRFRRISFSLSVISNIICQEYKRKPLQIPPNSWSCGLCRCRLELIPSKQLGNCVTVVSYGGFGFVPSEPKVSPSESKYWWVYWIHTTSFQTSTGSRACLFLNVRRLVILTL